MPLYSYECKVCATQIEKVQSVAQMTRRKGRERCPNCGERMHRLFKPPVLRTDTSFAASIGDTFNGDEWHRRRAIAKAEAAGVSTAGKRFYPQLCAPGVMDDPGAWISDSDARGDIARRCRELNYACDGAIKVKQREPESDPFDRRYTPAPDIVEAKVNERVEREFGGKVSAQKRKELTAETAERLAGNEND